MFLTFILLSITFYLLNLLCEKNNFLINKIKFSNHKEFIYNSNKLTIFAGLFLIIVNLI